MITTIAVYGLLTILFVFLIFHALILMKVIPYTVVWGGQLKSTHEMYRFETVSILINTFLLFVVMVYANMLAVSIPKTVTTLFLWLMAVLFAFNTLGNIVSKNKFENRILTPITIVLTIFSLILALAKG